MTGAKSGPSSKTPCSTLSKPHSFLHGDCACATPACIFPPTLPAPWLTLAFLPPCLSPPPARFALNLVEVYFEICHTRIMLLSPEQFRVQLRAALMPPWTPHPHLHPPQSPCPPCTPQSEILTTPEMTWMPSRLLLQSENSMYLSRS